MKSMFNWVATLAVGAFLLAPAACDTTDTDYDEPDTVAPEPAGTTDTYEPGTDRPAGDVDATGEREPGTATEDMADDAVETADEAIETADEAIDDATDNDGT